jgi:YggT family protein
MVLYRIVDGLFTGYIAMLTIAIISSWFPELEGYKAIRFVRYYTDPYLNFFRRMIPPLGMLDVSPIVAFIALRILEAIVKGVLFS